MVYGAGLTGSSEVAASKWIEVRPLKAPGDLAAAGQSFGLGIGETSAILLGKELRADVVLIDETKARRVARDHASAVLGCVGVLEHAFARDLLPDLRQAYRDLLASGA